MKAGTIVMVGSSTATVVYHGLDGYGIAWGIHLLPPDQSFWPRAEAMLRDPYPQADLPCVGEEYTVLKRNDDAF
jgi:hypothetical protein